MIHLFFLSSGGGTCCSASQGSLLGWSCPTPCQWDGLNVSWLVVWLLFHGGFPLLFRGSEQIWPCRNRWSRATGLWSPFFNKSSGQTISTSLSTKLHTLILFVSVSSFQEEIQGPLSLSVLCDFAIAAMDSRVPSSAAPRSFWEVSQCPFSGHTTPKADAQSWMRPLYEPNC